MAPDDAPPDAGALPAFLAPLARTPGGVLLRGHSTTWRVLCMCLDASMRRSIST